MDASVFRLVEEERVAITAVIHVDDIFPVGRKSWCDCFCEVFRPDSTCGYFLSDARVGVIVSAKI